MNDEAVSLLRLGGRVDQLTMDIGHARRMP